MLVLKNKIGQPKIPSVKRTREYLKFSPSEWWTRHLKRMNNIGLFRKTFPRRITQSVEKDLEKIVDVLTSGEPGVEEVWLFGSYARGTFNLRESDIDLAVFTNAQNCFYTTRKEGVPDEEDGWRSVVYKEPSEAIQRLMATIKNSSAFPEVYDVEVIANGEVPYVENKRRIEGKMFIREICRGGKCLYSKKRF